MAELDRIFEAHRVQGIDIRVETVQAGEPAVAPIDTPFAKELSRTIRDVTGREPDFELCPGILETRFFSNRGIPGYGYGPGILELSHGPGEYVDLHSLRQCAVVYAITALRLLT